MAELLSLLFIYLVSPRHAGNSPIYCRKVLEQPFYLGVVVFTFRKILTVLSCVILSTRIPLKAFLSRHHSQPPTTHVTVAVRGLPYMRLSSPKLTPGTLICEMTESTPSWSATLTYAESSGEYAGLTEKKDCADRPIRTNGDRLHMHASGEFRSDTTRDATTTHHSSNYCMAGWGGSNNVNIPFVNIEYQPDHLIVGAFEELTCLNYCKYLRCTAEATTCRGRYNKGWRSKPWRSKGIKISIATLGDV